MEAETPYGLLTLGALGALAYALGSTWIGFSRVQVKKVVIGLLVVVATAWAFPFILGLQCLESDDPSCGYASDQRWLLFWVAAPAAAGAFVALITGLRMELVAGATTLAAGACCLFIVGTALQ